ncbi:hypothetical protein AB0H76_22775 [Nocardia sp. NPDC050712]|uniref:hypothetical protein n=1 Tax=Nocardia sp. NPDC050712 TaxID=3155518 RepID=UPI0033F65B26
MTALLTVLVVAAFSYSIYHFAPQRRKDLFRLERFTGPGPLFESTLVTDYEAQRQYSDLAAIYGRRDVPDADAPALAGAPRVLRMTNPNPSCGTVQASFR